MIYTKLNSTHQARYFRGIDWQAHWHACVWLIDKRIRQDCLHSHWPFCVLLLLTRLPRYARTGHCFGRRCEPGEPELGMGKLPCLVRWSANKQVPSSTTTSNAPPPPGLDGCGKLNSFIWAKFLHVIPSVGLAETGLFGTWVPIVLRSICECYCYAYEIIGVVGKDKEICYFRWLRSSLNELKPNISLMF